MSVLVLEDVTMNGYGLSLEPLNYEETLFVTSKIAKWHAASMFMDRDVSLLPFSILFTSVISLYFGFRLTVFIIMKMDYLTWAPKMVWIL